MRKYILIISKFILVIAFLNIFAFSVRHVTSGGTSLGVFTNALTTFSEFPGLIKEVLHEAKSPSRLYKADANFQSLNNLKYDVFALNASFNSSKWNVNLTNLKNDSIIHQWYITEEDFYLTENDLYSDLVQTFSHAEIWSPILLEDRSIIALSNNTFNLYKLDSKSNTIWHNTDHNVHHSVNLDKMGNIWACTRKVIKFSPDKDVKYYDDYITQFDTKNGKTLFNKSIRDILLDNGLDYLVYGLSNHRGASYQIDPFHLNDIEPVINDGPFWKKGDLFLSLRSRSMILLYRPSKNKVLRVIQGPFFNQHDVDIQSDSIISIFNNNRSDIVLKNSTITNSNEIIETQQNMNPTLNKNSEIVVYNFKDSTFNFIYPSQFEKNKIYTETEGLHHVLSNGDMFIESQNDGKIYIFNEKEVLLKKYINPVYNNLVERPHWVRIYENINF